MYLKKKNTEKEKKTTPQHFCVAENCMLLEGGVLYGFTGSEDIDKKIYASHTYIHTDYTLIIETA